jgi:hypothetical protein
MKPQNKSASVQRKVSSKTVPLTKRIRKVPVPTQPWSAEEDAAILNVLGPDSKNARRSDVSAQVRALSLQFGTPGYAIRARARRLLADKRLQ